MERGIGEIFKYNGEWYQCVTGRSCGDCAFRNDDCEERERITLREKLTKEETTGLCVSELRSDCKSVIFKKLEKVGEPYFDNEYNIWIQAYRPYITVTDIDILSTLIFTKGDGLIHLEIKQNKEDMEEKKVIIGELAYKYISGKITYEAFIKVIKELCGNKEENKPILKEFNLEAAKAGKPVCTRDGRKARIICFDAKGDYPIIALIDNTTREKDFHYALSGRVHVDTESEYDLMMLPERKEGWAVIRKGDIYETKELAEKELLDSRTAMMIRKISWEE